MAVEKSAAVHPNRLERDRGAESPRRRPSPSSPNEPRGQQDDITDALMRSLDESQGPAISHRGISKRTARGTASDSEDDSLSSELDDLEAELLGVAPRSKETGWKKKDEPPTKRRKQECERRLQVSSISLLCNVANHA